MKNKISKICLLTAAGVCGGGSLILMCATTSCSEGIIDRRLQNHFVEWYNSLTYKPWNYDKNKKILNYHCDSEQQSLAMYANERGYYWNEYLHMNIEPPVVQNVCLHLGGENNPLEVRGKDYKYIVDALNKPTTKWPYDYKVYHGVEYQEVEFWDQLQEFIFQNTNGYDYSNCVGKTIKSYGFISTTLDKVEALRYCDGSKWNPGEPNYLPLKEQVVFEINIPKDIIGAVYLGDFKLMGYPNSDNQVLINTNCTFKIKKIWSEKNSKNQKVNVFEVDLISINND